MDLKISCRIKICVIAYCCAPNTGSEEGVGWGWTCAISEFADVLLVTRRNNVALLEEEIRNKKLKNINVMGIDLPIWICWWKKKSKGAMLYHYLWNFYVARYFRRMRNNLKINVFHHLNFAVTWQPCWIAFVGKTIHGPIDGVGIIHHYYWNILGFQNVIKELIRFVIVKFGENLDPFVFFSRRKISCFIYRTKFVTQKHKKMDSLLSVNIPDTAISDHLALQLSLLSSVDQNQSDVIRVVYTGRLVARKGVALVVYSFARAVKVNDKLELIIIGEGVEKKTLFRLAQKLKIENKIKFVGKLDQVSAWNLMATCQIFLYPSLRDAVATVVLEAMAIGLPVICLDNTGPSEVVNNDTGFVVPVAKFDETISNIAMYIVQLSCDHNLRTQMGKSAQEVVLMSHTWSARKVIIKSIYQQLGFLTRE